MRNVRALIAYDGTGYYGWQRQEGFDSIQERLEWAVGELLGVDVCVHGAGRTDTGVHALGQVASFHVDTPIEDDRLRHALNHHLPPGIVIRRLETCPEDFHARFSARGKRYVYRVATTRFRPPFGRDHAHWVRAPLDFAAMREAARALVGTHDFRAFASAGSPRSSYERTVARIRWIPRREAFAFLIEGNGFLYNMVRAVAGTLIEVGKGRRPAADVARILASQDRSQAGPTAPAAGLYLHRVLYSEPLFRGRDRGPGGAPGLFP